jgi:uncharacterized protein
MRHRLVLSLVSALTATTALSAQTAPLYPPGGDIPKAFAAPTQLLDYERRVLDIPMRDGVRLHTVMIIPRGLTRAPIMLDRTPYDAEKGLSAKTGGATLEDTLSPLTAELARAGYIIAMQDVRGKYGSGGDYVMNRPLKGSALNPTKVDHATDAFDTIGWLVKNVPESNGRVGTIGTSYDGFTALMSLVDPHPALKAAVPINPMVDVWKGDDWFHNGALRQEMISYVYGQTATKKGDKDWFAPAYDDYTTFLRYGSAGAYATAMGMDKLPFWQRLAQHPDYDAYWQGQAVDKILAARKLTVPTLLVHSLFDQEDIYGAPAVFKALDGKDNGNLHIVEGPWHHGQANREASALGPISFGGDTGAWFRQTVLLPFLDSHLKDGAAPVATPRITAFQTGTNRWQQMAAMPATQKRMLYLAPGGRLSFTPPAADGQDRYVSDPARPVTYRARPNFSPWATGSTWRQWLVDDQRFAEARPDVLTYTSDVLTAPVAISGQAVARLNASTSGTDSDWVVKLIDVYPDLVAAKAELGGYEWPVAMDILRGRYRDDPAHPTAIPANQPVRYSLALPTANHVFLPGHRIMVQVQSSWFPLYDRNPQSFVPNITNAKPSDYQAATQTILTGPQGSMIELPVVAN